MFSLMISHHARSSGTATRFPYTTLVRSAVEDCPVGRLGLALVEEANIEQHVLSVLQSRFLQRRAQGLRVGILFDLLVARVRRQLRPGGGRPRSEKHTSALQSLMRTSFAVFCL